MWCGIIKRLGRSKRFVLNPTQGSELMGQAEHGVDWIGVEWSGYG